MTTTIQPMNIDLRKYKRKENRRPPEQHPNVVERLSTNSNSPGSMPKRYQSVFSNGTPLTSFGVQNEENYTRARSPQNHIGPQIHQRSFKPVREFLSTHPLDNQQVDDRRRSPLRANGLTRSQTEATVQNVNIALTQTLNKLRQEPSHPGTTSARASTTHAESKSTRPITARATTYQNTGTTTTTSSLNHYYPYSNGTKGSLPSELTTRRPPQLLVSNILPNGTSHQRVSSEIGPPIVQRSTPPTVIDIKTNEHPNMRPATPLRIVTNHHETDLNQFDKFNFNTVTLDEHVKRSKSGKNDANQQKVKSRKQSPASHTSSVDKQHRTLPEVSVHPHIQSTVQASTDQLRYIHEPIVNGETYTNHHHIQVEPANEVQRILSSSGKSQQVIDVQPHIIVQHSKVTSPIKEPRKETYGKRDHTRPQALTLESPHTVDNDSTSTLKQYEHQPELMNNPLGVSAPPPSPSNREFSRLLKKQRSRNSFRTGTGALVARKNSKHHRPLGRLKNYDDDSDSELTVTEPRSKEDDVVNRNDALPSDLLSDVWSDLTSEFSDTKLRKHPNIRTSTPNITRQSSSISSKELGQMRRQLYDLKRMYNDLLKLFDNDIESMRSSIKSNTSSQNEQNARKTRFRKATPALPMRQSNTDMREINQRFTRIESSIVTLAESIAKLSAQVQAQRTVKDDVSHLREEIAELHQHLSQQQTSLPTVGRSSRLITANVQRLAVINSTNPINMSTSTNQRSNSIIDPRQARKIEQFFGTEAMLRYFLSLLDYDAYASVLEEGNIGFCELPFINERKLQSLGIPYGPCTRIIYEAQQYFTSLMTLKSNGFDV